MARAKYLDAAKDYKQAVEMYGMIVAKFNDTVLSDVARLRMANGLQILGSKEELRTAKQLLNEYLQSPRKKDAEDEAIYQLAWVYHDLNLASHGRKRFEKLVLGFEFRELIHGSLCQFRSRFPLVLFDRALCRTKPNPGK